MFALSTSLSAQTFDFSCLPDVPDGLYYNSAGTRTSGGNIHRQSGFWIIQNNVPISHEWSRAVDFGGSCYEIETFMYAWTRLEVLINPNDEDDYIVKFRGNYTSPLVLRTAWPSAILEYNRITNYCE